MSVVTINKNIQGGTPCFAGTRVPVSSLFDCLKDGCTVEEFLSDFPSVSREQVQAVLDLAKDEVPKHAEASWDRGESRV